MAVYHCNETQEALTLWHQKPRFFSNYVNEHFPRAKREKGAVPVQKRKASICSNTQRIDFSEISYEVRRKQTNKKKIISCLCHQYLWRWLSPKVICKNLGQVLCVKQNKKTKYKHTQPDSTLLSQIALPLGWAENVKIQTVASLHESTKWNFNDLNHRMRESKECSHFSKVPSGFVLLSCIYYKREIRHNKDYTPIFHLQCLSSGRTCMIEATFK